MKRRSGSVVWGSRTVGLRRGPLEITWVLCFGSGKTEGVIFLGLAFGGGAGGLTSWIWGQLAMLEACMAAK